MNYRYHLRICDLEIPPEDDDPEDAIELAESRAVNALHNALIKSMTNYDFVSGHIDTEAFVSMSND